MKNLKITVAKTAGFCFGVDSAVKKVYNKLNSGLGAAMLGELVHNPDVIGDLERRGVRVISSPADALPGEIVFIRAHGESADVYRQLEKRRSEGVTCEDCTCPHVKRIRELAAKCAAEGVVPVIMGDKDHPEVRGIASHAGGAAVILPDERALQDFLEKNFQKFKKRLAIMAQTTYNINIWGKCAETAAAYPEAKVYRTICTATSERQEEAARLAEENQMMIVIGGRHSSNTAKLYTICKERCENTFCIENAEDIKELKMPQGFSDKCDIRVGITAGASTPAHIIKEVKNQMSEKIMNTEEDFNFEEAIDASFKRIYTGNRVKGYITAVNNTEAIVDVGTKHTGYVSLSELTDDPSLKPCDVVKVGDEVDLIVLKINDAEGTVQLSKKKVDAQKGLDDVIKAKEDGSVLEGVVTDVVKGGVIARTNGVRVFIPASQATLRRDEKLEELVKKTVKFKILEVNESRSRAVGSIRAVLAAEREEAKAKFWENVQLGDVFKGEVKSMTSYGAFVDLGGVDGMVHISELSWSRIKNPAEVVSVGDVLEVYVKDLDREKGRISLGYKKSEDDPWVKFENSYKVGDVVTCKVVSITPFGAFARIMDGIDGLIHISQVSDKRVANVKDAVSVGDDVTVKITEIDPEKKRISLSIKAVLEEGAASDEGSEE